MDYRNDVSSFFGHIDQISTDSVREFNSIDNSSWANNVRHVRNSCAWSCAQVKDFCSWNNCGFWDTTNNWCCDFWAIGIPDSILNFLSVDFDTNSLFVVDWFSRNHILGDKAVLSTSCDEDAWESMRLNEDLGCSPGSTSWRTSSSSGRSSSSRCISERWSASSSFLIVVEFPHKWYDYRENSSLMENWRQSNFCRLESFSKQWR